MKLSAPIYLLKSQAKKLKATENISLSQALDQIAKKEGFQSWSLLITKSEQLLPSKYTEILDFLNPGDLVLVGARPGKGKTSFSIGLFVQAIEKQKAKNFYFTLAETHRNTAGRIADYNQEIGHNNKYLALDYSNDICSEYIIAQTKNLISPGSLILIDYLQILDEKRTNPSLQNQLDQLHSYAKETGAILIFISQMRRELDDIIGQKPTIQDIRLPNPLDLSVFNKMFFLNHKDDGQAQVLMEGKIKHNFLVTWNSKKATFSD